jgi:RNA polymerase sigma factor (sigma-70 family)
MRTEDGCIIHRCLNGEPGAFGLLVDKYKEGIYAFVYDKLGSFHDAQDVTQEVFVQAYRDLHSLRRWESFVFWLYRIASTRCKLWIRTQSRRIDRDFIEDQNPRILSDSSMDSYRDSQVTESLREALDMLSENYRTVLMLHYFGGMSSNEIAKSLGTSPSAIRKRLSRARIQLREGMVATMGTAFEEQRLPSGFTFRVVEAVKRIKTSPTPRASRLPWSISLAAGIVLTVLSMNPQLSLHDQISFPKGSPLPTEMKVPKTGEIPVEVLKVSQLTAIAIRSEDGDGGETRHDDERGTFLLAPQASEVKLLPRDGAAEDNFGDSVSVYGDYAIVGAVGKDDGKGAAYIFKSDGGLWKENGMLFAGDGGKDDWFGDSVAISGEFAFVGARYDDDRGEDTGSVYIFHRTGESWTQQVKLNPHGDLIKWCHFGRSLDVSGDCLIVGSSQEDHAGGAIYIFKRDGEAWKEQDKLKSSNWAQFDRFGWDVSISGDYVIAGAPNHENNTGSAYIFKREGDIWKEQAILTAGDGEVEDRFGISVHISGDYAIVGAYMHSGRRGAAYIFVREGASWRQQAKITSADVMPGDWFGICVSISADYAIVGAHFAGGKGAIYGFIRNGSSWREVRKQTASDSGEGDYYGYTFAFSGNYAIVGACEADVSGENSGAAYIYRCAEFFPVELTGFSATTFGREKNKPAMPEVMLLPPDKQSIPKNSHLLQNYPNPFNPETWLPYELASGANAVIQIHNSSGELVRNLSQGRQEAGFYTDKSKAAYWDGRNEAGEQVGSGVYFYTIQAGDFTATRKMLVAR